MSEAEIVKLKAEIIIMKWHHLKKYLDKAMTGKIQRDLMRDIETGLEELAGKKVKRLIPGDTLKD